MSLSNRKRNASLAGAFFAGAASGCCSTVLFQPFDVVKTRQQECVAGGAKRRTMVYTFTSLSKSEGLLSLWSGLAPSLWRCVPGVALYFTSLEAMKSLVISQNNQSLGPIQALLLGASARSISGTLLMPFTVIKTRFESGTFNYKSVFHALSVIYRTEGIRGLTSGITATLARDVPFSAIYYATYSHLKQHQAESSVSHSFSCGIISGIFASVVTHPADVVKTSMQLFPSRYRHDPLRRIFKDQGFSGFFVGLLPRLVRRTLIATMSWTVYDKVMQSFGME